MPRINHAAAGALALLATLAATATLAPTAPAEATIAQAAPAPASVRTATPAAPAHVTPAALAQAAPVAATLAQATPTQAKLAPATAQAPTTTPTQPTERLAGPFPAETFRPAPLACPATPPPVRDLAGVGFYADKSASVVDPRLQKQDRAAVGPVRAYLADVDRLVEAHTTGAASCALGLMAGWAADGALLGQTNQQGAYEQQWTLAGLALAYLRIRDVPGLDPTAGTQVQAWLAAIAHAVQPSYSRPQRKDNRNNHAYWTGLAVGAAGAAAGDRALFDWGIARARLGIAEVQPDGTLPLEMLRRARALHYHLFALTPLVLLAELGAHNGIDLYAENDHAIARLAARAAEGLSDPQWFATRAGAAQDLPADLSRGDLAWTEPLLARFGTPDTDRWLKPLRPIRLPWAGGDLTAIYGAVGGRK